MARLPTVGGDANDWGTVLNDYLSQAHDGSGNLKSSAISAALADGSIPSSKLDNTTQSLLTRASDAPMLIVYNTTTNSYAARPAGLPGGSVTYRGPVAPSDAVAPDVWEDTSSIWP